jgi:arylsulfatase A-like enzyme/thioredoxin-like negative regulator of GroEL
VLLAAAALLVAACAERSSTPQAKPAILLVTLDTTRADSIGPDARGVETPAFNEVAARGRRFTQAYATVPETLPSHASMLTGLYPAGHGIHENARYLADSHPVVAERLKSAGYRTAAFVSSFVLSRRFGLARGFDVYDDEQPSGAPERSSQETTDRAIEYLQRSSSQPLLLWVHYFDPHTPYAPPEPFAARHRNQPYLGEVAAMDHQLGRLVQAFEQHAAGPRFILVVSDHGEALGEHGELQHGNLLYQPTMLVPLVIAGPGITASTSDSPVSTRRIFHTLLDLAGLDSTGSLRGSHDEVVLGEAMKPFLSYGWQPQIMGVNGKMKAIFAGTTEVYDLARDPSEARNLGSGASLPPALRKTLDEYPVPSVDAAKPPADLTEDARRSLASLGYVSATAAPIVRKDAPRPVDMATLFPVIDRASGLFVAERYHEVIPLLRQILQRDPYNLDAALRLATAHSSLNQEADALAAFRRAAEIAPRSPDVRLYLTLHQARGKEWRTAVAPLEKLVAENRERQPAVEALARLKGRLGEEAMQEGRTAEAIASFEHARRLGLSRDLELGVLYLADRRLQDARAALDRVPPTHPDYAMALFKRAQVSVLLDEPDAAARIAAARARADATTRPLIERERLFQRGKGR